jgi:hypothetical protein
VTLTLIFFAHFYRGTRSNISKTGDGSLHVRVPALSWVLTVSGRIRDRQPFFFLTRGIQYSEHG